MVCHPLVNGEQLADDVGEGYTSGDFAVVRGNNDIACVSEDDAVIGVGGLIAADKAAAVYFHHGLGRLRLLFRPIDVQRVVGVAVVDVGHIRNEVMVIGGVFCQSKPVQAEDENKQQSQNGCEVAFHCFFSLFLFAAAFLLCPSMRAASAAIIAQIHGEMQRFFRGSEGYRCDERRHFFITRPGVRTEEFVQGKFINMPYN